MDKNEQQCVYHSAIRFFVKKWAQFNFKHWKVMRVPFLNACTIPPLNSFFDFFENDHSTPK